MSNSEKHQYDLKPRILRFVISIIEITRKLPRDRVNNILIQQLIASATSIGANYEEADGARSKKEFIAVMGIIKKEAKETKYWLKVIRLTNANKFHEEIDKLGKEAEELIKIFAKIIINSKSNE